MSKYSDIQNARMVFQFLADPRSDKKIKTDTLNNISRSPDKKTYGIACYLADDNKNVKVKKAILTILDLSPEELSECITLING